MTIRTNFGRAGSPRPAARPFASRGAHGVTRPACEPIAAGNWYNLVWFRLCGSGVLLLIAVSFCGCVTEAQANARARAAYIQGQKAAFASMGGLGQGVAIIGPVQRPNVPWVEGLTLAQAIATANYISHHSPKAITITRQGEEIEVDPRDLLGGHVVPLEPGDTIRIRE